MPGISAQAGEHEIVVPGKFLLQLQNGKTKKWCVKIHANRLVEDGAARGSQKLKRNFTLLRRDVGKMVRSSLCLTGLASMSARRKAIAGSRGACLKIARSLGMTRSS